MMELKITVPSVIMPGSRIWIVGEAPGRNEEQQGRPFVGVAGRLLDKILLVGGVDRATVSVTNVVKRAPDGGFDSEHFRETFYETIREVRRTEVASKRCKHCAGTLRQHSAKRRRITCGRFEAAVVVKEKFGRKSTRPTEELQMYVDLLQRELTDHRPTVVIAAGGEALRALCEVDGISNYRGSVLECTLVPGIKVVPILHPSAILRGAQWQEVWVQGMIIREKVVPLAAGKLEVRKQWVEILEPNHTEIRTILRGIDGPYTLDIETRGGSLACVGIASETLDGDEFAICIPIQTTSGPFYTPEEELVVLQAVGELLQRNPNLILQNGTYDLDYLMDYGIVASGVLLDTMLAFHVLYAELPKGLDFLTMKYTTMPYYKEEGKTWGSSTPDEDLWRYNIKDVIATLRVGKALMEELRPIGEMFFGYWMKLYPIALEMQRLGMEVDMEELGELRQVIHHEIERIHGELVERAGELNVGSPSQVAKFLYQDLKLPTKKKRGKGTITTDEDALMELLAKFPESRELKLVMAERHLRKSLESYIDVPLERE